MARIVQSLTQPLPQYDQQIQQSFVRDVDSVVQKLNTSFQQEIKGVLEGTITEPTGIFAAHGGRIAKPFPGRSRDI